MAIRIKSVWRRSRRNKSARKNLEDNAVALAFIVWRLALEGAKTLNREGFDYLCDRARVGVISEFIAFQVQLADRLVYGSLDDADRALFVNVLGRRLAQHMQENLTDIAA